MHSKRLCKFPAGGWVKARAVRGKFLTEKRHTLQVVHRQFKGNELPKAIDSHKASLRGSHAAAGGRGERSARSATTVNLYRFQAGVAVSPTGTRGNPAQRKDPSPPTLSACTPTVGRCSTRPSQITTKPVPGRGNAPPGKLSRRQ